MAQEKNATRVLEQIEAHLAKQNVRLGFCDSPYGELIYANNQYGDFWYLWDHHNEKAEELKPCLRCLIKNLKLFVKQNDKHGDTVKLHVHVDAGRKYVIESGAKSQFALSLLNKIAVADKAMLEKPVYIKMQPADKTMFGNLYSLDGEGVFVEDYDEDAERVYQRACGNLGVTPDEWPDPDQQPRRGQQQGQGRHQRQPRGNGRSQNQGRQRRSQRRSQQGQGQQRQQQGGQRQQQPQQGSQNWVANLDNQQEPQDQEWKELWSEFHELGIELHGRDKWVNKEFPSLRQKYNQRFLDYDKLVEEIDNLDRELSGGAPPGFEGAFEPDDDLPF